jgi:hypothetical protein
LLGAVAAACCLATVPAFASPDKKQVALPLPRAEFHAICPFTLTAPSVLAVLDGKRWVKLLSAARTVPPPHEAGATNFRRESIVIVALRHTPTPITQAALSAKRPQRFDPESGTLTLWYEVQQTIVKEGEVATTVMGEPCLITWVARRNDLRRIVARTSDGRYIAGTRISEPRKKGPAPEVPSK